jgi:hypothetical protein
MGGLRTRLADHARTAKPAQVAPLRIVRLATDAQPAGVKLEGPALWRRSEPGIRPSSPTPSPATSQAI